MTNLSPHNLRNIGQELYELGPKGAAFRVAWEMSRRAGLHRTTSIPVAAETETGASRDGWTAHLPFPDPLSVADCVRDRIPPASLRALHETAAQACLGRIESFGRWTADFGDPIRWHCNPLTGQEWPARAPWWRALTVQGSAGDVKLAWEAARFPHAYHLARSAAFMPSLAPTLARTLSRQIRGFIESNPHGLGIHWASGQEVAFRLLAWLFAADTLLLRVGEPGLETLLRRALLTGASHIENDLNYARFAVYNNHLLSEALGLFAVGALLPDAPEARRWRDLGRRILDQESSQQFYSDGAYIQQSHNYHRVALLDLLWACAFARSMGDRPSQCWLDAIDRSIEFLVAQQNPTNGHLPNYGSNDGSKPGLFSTCDFNDFRPVLQTAHLLVRGQRLYDVGPWDEMAAWMLGPSALDEPIAPPRRTSRSFTQTGYHVLRGADETSFATFRCGSLLDRFSQIDMLHVDVWWRGLNVLVDAGSYLYNDRPKWHEHFVRTSCHNTVVIDGRDQMLHFRQFKVLYRTRARLLAFEHHDGWSLCAGEHDGYRRHQGACVHRRSVLFLHDDLWVVVDRIHGNGAHAARLHWLAGDFPFAFEPETTTLSLDTSAGRFLVQVLDVHGEPMPGDVAAGQDEPPRGWQSRHYGEKTAVASLAVAVEQVLPVTFVSVLSGTGRPRVRVDRTQWSIEAGGRCARFVLDDGLLSGVAVTPSVATCTS